jgi:cytochrome P450
VSLRTTQSPRDDMIDVLLSAEIDGERLHFEDVVSNAMLLVQAGLETTANAMSYAFHHLATHYGDRDRLIGEPDLMPKAIEEFLRFAGSIHGIPRTVAKKVEVSGHTFRPGESVVVDYASANRDDDAFPEPDRCLLDRTANRHLGIGAGVHRRLGSNLARLEFRIGVEQALRRMSELTLAPGDAADFRGTRSPADTAVSRWCSPRARGPLTRLPKAIQPRPGRCGHEPSSVSR